MQKLKPRQREAIGLMPDHNLQIIACAGSGKTEVITRGVTEILRRGTNPASVVAFTFTEKAAEEMKARIRHLLMQTPGGTAGLGDMYVGTIHSWCLEALRQLRPEFRSFDVLDEAGRVAFLSKPYNYYNRIGLVGLEQEHGIGKYTTVSRFIDSTEIVLNEGVSLARLRKADPRTADAVGAYRKALMEDRYLDFSTMIHELVELLENDDAARRDLHARLRHVVVDEYQDVNGLQERLIRAMVGPDTRIAVVGDDDQSIYGWRGAVVQYIRDFAKTFPKVKTVRIEENFRSTRGVVALANAYIRRNARRLAKKMVAKGPMPYAAHDIQYRHFDTEHDQAEFIASRIRELLGTDFTDRDGSRFAIAPGDVGILVRSNADIQQLLPFLSREGIDYVVDSGESVFDQDLVQWVLGLLDWLFALSDDPGEAVDGYLALLEESGRKNPGRATMMRRLNALRKKVDAIAARGDRDYLPELGLQGLYHELLDAIGIRELDLTDAEHFYLASLSQAVTDYEKVWQRLRHREYKYFRGFVTAWAERSYAVPGTQIGDITRQVKVMTIHKAKGLEFPVVFVPYLNRKRKGHRNPSFVPEALFDARRYDDDGEEERHVYYVAITRSRKYLFLSGMREDPRVKNPREPAAVVGELDRKLLSAPAKIRAPRSGLPERRPDHGLSTTFSELSAYGRCGYDYKLRFFYGYNAGVPAAFGYGTQIHNILNIIHTRYRDRKLTDAQVEKLVNGNFYLRYAPGAMSDAARKAAVWVVQNYVRRHFHEFGWILETEKRFEMTLGNALITGQIDLVKRLDPEGNVREVEVIDFKSDAALLDREDSQHQLRLYVGGLRDALKLEPKKATLQDLETDTKKDVEISEAAMKRSTGVLRERIEGIQRGVFTPARSKRICPSCDYCRICRHAVS